MVLGKHLWRVHTLASFVFVMAFATAPVSAQAPENKNAAAAPSTSGVPSEVDGSVQSKPKPQEPPEPPGGKRVFGVLPNYRTVNESQVNGPLTARQKFTIASKDSFDYPLVLLAAGLAGIGQGSNQNPSFGQGMEGFGKRLITGYADQAIGNIMTEGLFPSVLHEDPRYYRRGTGSAWSRTGYAVSRILVTHTDSGGTRFNYSEWLGNASATALSNAYYPDGRRAGANAVKLVEQCGIDGLSQVFKEFWPDIKNKLFDRKHGTREGH